MKHYLPKNANSPRMEVVVEVPWEVETQSPDEEMETEPKTEYHPAADCLSRSSIGFFGFQSRPETNERLECL